AAKMASRIKQAKIDEDKANERRAKRERCETEKDPRDEKKDRKITDARKRMDCHIARLEDMDEDEAADHYEKYIMPELEGMVSSSDVRKQRQGMALLKQLNADGAGGDFMKESIRDLAKFGQFNYQANQQKLKIMGMNPNDPARALEVQNMRVAQFQADGYFRSRGLMVDNQVWPMDSTFDYTNTLTDDLARFQTRLDQNFASLLQQHQFLLQNPATVQQQQLQQQQALQAAQSADGRTVGIQNTAMQLPANAWPGGAQQAMGVQPIDPNGPQANPSMSNFRAPVNQPTMSKSTIQRPLTKR
ncbi:MAG: hypothetical protein ACXVA9_03390, partial [Bdellovibrionales bacterium]